jgi:aldehyde:ferredoxin oxidoreductase
MKGFYGRFLLIDLAKRSQRIMGTPEEVCSNYLGGKGLGSWLLTTYIPRE